MPAIGHAAFEHVGARGKRRRLRLLKNYLYALPDDTVLCVPQGFVTDGPSVPKLFRWYADAIDLSLDAALVHDFLYRCRGIVPVGLIEPRREFTRAEVDRLFYDMLLEAGIRRSKAWVVYAAVRTGGLFAWMSGNAGALRLDPATA